MSDTSAFDSDEAFDDLYDVEAAEVLLDALVELMERLSTDPIYLGDVEGPVAAACLVACRLADLTPDEEWAAEWLQRNPFTVTDTLRRSALTTLDIAMRPDNNELYDLWQTHDALEDWLGELGVYRRALA